MSDYNETLNKYVAGFVDADGTIAFHFNKTVDGFFRIGLQFGITQIDNRGRGFKLLQFLRDSYDVGSITDVKDKNQKYWKVSGKNDLEKFLPHVIKHMVIKGKHFQRMLDKRRELSGVNLTQEQVDELRKFAKESRADTGPTRYKKNASPAWLAGYIDGDGYLRCSDREHWLKIHVQKSDVCSVELIQSTYGGKIYKTTKENIKEFKLNFGASFYGTATKVLKAIIPHLRLKRHDAEMILYWHKQRLNEKNPTG